MSVRTIALALSPLVLLAGLLALIAALDPASALRGDAPPVEVLAFQRVELTPAGIEAHLLNDGPDPVTIAQVAIDDAYWSFTAEPADLTLGHLGRTTLSIPYPWVAGESHELRVITATGITFDHRVEVAIETPQPSWRFFGIFALIGLYVGVLPVALGLLWYPLVGRLSRRGLDFLLALTLGLLVFLLVDAVTDGAELAGALPDSYQGIALFAFAAAAAYLAIEALGRRLRGGGDDPTGRAWVTALLVAVGIGLHNFGEGLAIGAAFVLGEAALGSLLIIGFTLHNTTEGLAIVAPLAATRASAGRLLLLGTIAGVPTVAGAWVGGFVYSPVWSVVFLAIGAGAIAQVVVQITRGVAGERSIARLATSGAVVAGLTAGFALMYLTGTLVG